MPTTNRFKMGKVLSLSCPSCYTAVLPLVVCYNILNSNNFTNTSN